MAKSKKTEELLNKVEQTKTYLDWQREMLEAVIADMDSLEVEEDE